MNKQVTANDHSIEIGESTGRCGRTEPSSSARRLTQSARRRRHPVLASAPGESIALDCTSIQPLGSADNGRRIRY